MWLISSVCHFPHWSTSFHHLNRPEITDTMVEAKYLIDDWKDIRNRERTPWSLK